mgnify:CR=1 FL=1
MVDGRGSENRSQVRLYGCGRFPYSGNVRQGARHSQMLVAERHIKPHPSGSQRILPDTQRLSVLRPSQSGRICAYINDPYGFNGRSDGSVGTFSTKMWNAAKRFSPMWLNSSPEITSLMYVINEKCNDTITDQDVLVFRGKDHIIEEMEGLQFKVGPKSFYQTNSEQAYELYKVAREFAGLTGNEMVYDLYTGTGTIANFVSRQAKKVIGIEYVPEAIEDAKVNSSLNKIENTLFYAGDMKDILTQDFINQHGRPDVIITDPPRAGMHDDVINTILFAEPERIVYVSCNPATQARDLSLLSVKYAVKKVQPVDMFPHTHHVENVVLLEKLKVKN